MIALDEQWLSANQQYLSKRVGAVMQRLQASADLEPLTAAWEPTLPTAAIDRVAQVFGLSDFEVELLLLCAAVELASDWRELCAKMGVSTGQPTFGLAMGTLSSPHWSALLPCSPLRRLGLLHVTNNGVLTAAPLQVDEHILHYLVTGIYFDPQLDGWSVHVAPEPVAPSHDQLALELSQELLERSVGPAVVCVLSGRDSETRAVAAAACAKQGRALFFANALALPSSAHARRELALRWQRQAALTGSVLFLETPRDSERRQAAAEFVDATSALVFVGCAEALPTMVRRCVRHTLSPLSAAEQRLLWGRALGPALVGVEATVTALSEQFVLDWKRIVEVAMEVASVQASPERRSKELWRLSRSQTRAGLDGIAERIEPVYDWSDLVLPEPQLEALKEMALQVRHRAQVHAKWGFGAGHRGLSVTALFHGVSGTGKTMAADILARELDLDLYRIDLSQLVNKYIGETEKNLKRAFDAADEGGGILLFDEADSLFGKRTEVRDSHDRYANLEVNYLLARMESYRGVAILTTNMKDSLDPAFVRRLRFIVQFPFPDLGCRTKMWERAFPSDVRRDDLAIERLALLNLTGASIHNVAIGASFLAAAAGEAVNMAHVMRAARREYAKLEKPFGLDRRKDAS